MKENYLEIISLIERLHRLFLEVVKNELDNLDIEDINNVQALVLYNLGDAQITIGELITRGCYLGSNVSYNLKKMVQNGYVEQVTSKHDKRSYMIKLSPKGMKLCQKLDVAFDEHISKISKDKKLGLDFKNLVNALRSLESFWNDIGMQHNRFGIGPKRR